MRSRFRTGFLALFVIAVAACSSGHTEATKPSASSTTTSSTTTTPTTAVPLTTAQQEQGMASGLPLQDPPEIDATPANKLRITLNVKSAQVDIAGKKVWAETYNNSYTGPTLHFAAGRTATIEVVNHLDQPTNMHYHGMHVSPSGHSDDQFLCIAPGKSFTYVLDMPADTPSGTLFYHSHSMATTCPHSGEPDMNMDMGAADVENQMFAGLSGAIIIGDDRSQLPRAMRTITTHQLVLKDTQIDRTGHIVQNEGASFIDPSNPSVRLVNGMLRPVIAMQPGETQLWKLVNAGADMSYQAVLPGSTFTIVNVDGQPVAKAWTEKMLQIPPGRRWDVLVTAPATAGTATLSTQAFNTGPAGNAYPDAPLATVEVGGLAKATARPVIGAMPGVAPDLTNAKIATRRTLTLSENNNGMYINGKVFDFAKSIFDQPAVLGTVEEWTIKNTSGEMHPFHLHVSSYQVMSINGVAQPYRGAQDVEWVPHTDAQGHPGELVIRIPFRDFIGRYMFHCHIAGHEDFGMMSFINVVAAPA